MDSAELSSVSSQNTMLHQWEENYNNRKTTKEHTRMSRMLTALNCVSSRHTALLYSRNIIERASCQMYTQISKWLSKFTGGGLSLILVIVNNSVKVNFRYTIITITNDLKTILLLAQFYFWINHPWDVKLTW